MRSRAPSPPPERDAPAARPPAPGLDTAALRPICGSMRLAVALSLIWLAGTAGAAAAATHHYTRAERYAGCMFGETIPLMRRGTERERALSIASDRCIAWSEGLSENDIREVDLQLHRAIERSERSGL